MARMIPSSINPENVASPGEREVFRRLQKDPTTANWIVLHSLDVANHRKQVAGEVDFVAIVPQKGVLCIEVKACSQLRREAGLWYYGSDPVPDSRGPFKQAAESMHSLRNRLKQRDPDLGHIVFWSAAIFPYVEFMTESEEWHSWQVIDSRLFRSRALGSSLEYVLEQARRFLSHQKTASWFNPHSSEPTAKQCDLIAQLLRPSFEFFESPKVRTQRLESELKHYTQEQFVALDAMEANERVIFEGPAGTGKTMLAVEAARRGSLAGRKVLLICFNRLLGQWLIDQTRVLQPQVTLTTLHSHMLAASGVRSTTNDSAFWQDELPAMAIDKMLEIDREEFLFDELIVDEAQDILHNNYLDFLDLSLKGGLATGRWRFFGDFAKQTIYGSKGISLEKFRSERAPLVSLYSLRTNCRNTPRVADLVRLLGDGEPEYSRVLRPDDRVDPELYYYKDNEDQKRLLIKTLERLFDSGYSGQDIVVLSTRGTTTCIASQIGSEPWSSRLKPFATTTSGHIGYCSIHGFKGLESPAVIITDIEQLEDRDRSWSLFYIAATRCLQKLVILMHRNVQEDITKMLVRS